MLGGGGLLGAMYEIGCLASLEQASYGGRLNFDLYVGTSCGSVVASLLAAGYSATELMNMVEGFSPNHLCRLDLAAFLRAGARLSSQLARRALTGLTRSSWNLSGTLALFQQALPAGFLGLEPLESMIREWIQARGLDDTFAALPHRLFIPTLDLDTGERVIFGDDSSTGASVSTAVAASCATPRFFKPVVSGSRHLIDGGIADSLNLDIATVRGVREVVVVNPLVAPFNDRSSRCLPSPEGGCGHVADQGLVIALGQAMKIGHMIHSAMSLDLHRHKHPDVVVNIIQPNRLVVDLDNPMDFRGRDRLLTLGKLDGIRFLERVARKMEPVAATPDS